MSLQAKRGSILTYIKAKSPSGLRRLISRIEAKDGIVYDWSIHKDGSAWVAYYRKSIQSFDQELKEMEAE